MRSDNARHMFRNLFLALIFAMGFLPLNSIAGSKEELVEKGNKLYAAGRFKEALQVYGQVLRGGEHSAALYFNMGNSSFRLNDIPSALLYYEKAAKLSPGDPDVVANIRFVNSRIADKIEVAPEFFLSRWWNSICLAFPVNTLAIVSLTLVLGGSVLLIVYFYAEQLLLKKSAFYAAVIAFFCGCLVVYMLMEQHRLIQGKETGIVFSNPVYLKSSPSGAAKSTLLIHEGLKVSIIERSGQWLKVQLANGKTGWMLAADLKEI